MDTLGDGEVLRPLDLFLSRIFSFLARSSCSFLHASALFFSSSNKIIFYLAIRISFFALAIDHSEKIRIIYLMKNEKKVEKTKATLVREVEAKFKVKAGFFDSLERANKETIVKLLSL